MKRTTLNLIWLVAALCIRPDAAFAEMWVCEQLDGSYLFTDRGTADCQVIQKESEKDNFQITPSRQMEAVKPVPAATVKTNPSKTQTVAAAQKWEFPPSVQRVPVLMVNQLSAKQESQGFYSASRGEVALVDLAVSHVASGTGPEVVTDSHFGGHLDVSLRAAVAAAAKAVGYDPRFLRVRLSVKTSILQSGLYIEGPSAGAILAVGVASALLGDPLRPDVCMSGTINEGLEVGAVGGLEEKIKGCRQLNYREMILPTGQTSMELALKSRTDDIRITEVNTLDAAYQAATGQSIRSITLR